MQTLKQLILVLAFTLAASAAQAAVQVAAQGATPTPAGRDPAFEQAVREKLEKIDPAAVAVFDDATRALDADQLDDAKRGFERVLELAPGFPDAERRLSHIELAQDHVDAAIRWARAALDHDPSSGPNEAALAIALLAKDNLTLTDEALRHARAAVSRLPKDAEANLALAFAGASAGELDAVETAVANLLAHAPDHPAGHFFAGLLAADEGDRDKARAELQLSRTLGMPEEVVAEALSRLDRRGWIAGLPGLAILLVGGWIAGLALLAVVGLALSRITLITVERQVAAPTPTVGSGERAVRTVYRAVIGLTSLFFYLSMPMLALVVVAAVAGILWLFWNIGTMPVQLLLMLVLAGAYTLWAITKSLFVRIRSGEPGVPLLREQAPDLWALTEAVAQQVGTRPVDDVYLQPGTIIAVTERGGMLDRLRGRTRRCLIVGLGVVSGLEQGQFKAILAHEYGHFSNRDTAGGGLAMRVQAGIYELARGLAMSGQAQFYNPAWLFVNGFYRIYMRITLGASRLQEILADRYAAMTYGADNLIKGLQHVIRRSIEFELSADAEIRQAMAVGKPLSNLYALPPLTGDEALQRLDEAYVEAIIRPTDPYDSHPGFRDRVAYLHGIVGSEASSEHDGQPVWALFGDAASVQDSMTQLVQKSVKQDVEQAT